MRTMHRGADMRRRHQTLTCFGGLALGIIFGACGIEKKTTANDPASTSTSDATTDTPTGTEAPSTCPERPQTDKCCCFEEIRYVDAVEFLSGTKSICGVHPLCPEMTFKCDVSRVGCPDGVLTTDNEDAITCSLQALADGKAGRVSWLIENSQGPGGRSQVWFDLVGDGTLFRQRNDALDLCAEVSPVQHLPLPASSHYENCLAEPDWQSQFECLRKVPFGEPIETCLDGDEYFPADSPGNGC